MRLIYLLLIFGIFLSVFTYQIYCDEGNESPECTGKSSVSLSECKALLGDTNEDHLLFHSDYLNYYQDAAERIENCKNLYLHSLFSRFTVYNWEYVYEYASPRYVRDNCNDIIQLSSGDLQTPPETNQLMMQIAKQQGLVSLEYDSVDYIKRFENHYASLILFIGNSSSSLYDVYASLAREKPEMVYLHSNSEEVKKMYGVEENKFVMFSANGAEINVFEDEDKASLENYLEFVNKYQFTGVYYINSLSAYLRQDTYFIHKKDYIVLFLKEDDDQTEAIKAIFRKIEDEFKGEFVFIVYKLQKHLDWYDNYDLAILQIKYEETPAVRIIRHEAYKGSMWSMENPITEENLRVSINEHKEGKGKLILKSQEIPAEPYNGDFRVVVGKTWKEIVLDPTKNVIVYIHYGNPRPNLVLREVARKYKYHEDLVFAEMDGNQNEVAGHDFSEIIVFYSKDNNTLIHNNCFADVIPCDEYCANKGTKSSECKKDCSGHSFYDDSRREAEYGRCSVYFDKLLNEMYNHNADQIEL